MDYSMIQPGAFGTQAAELYMDVQHHETPVRPRCGIG